MARLYFRIETALASTVTSTLTPNKTAKYEMQMLNDPPDRERYGWWQHAFYTHVHDCVYISLTVVLET